MTKVEEVRAAIRAAISEIDPYAWSEQSEGSTSLRFDGYLDLDAIARAAIEAMRIPSEGMVTAGIMEIASDSSSHYQTMSIWQAMLTAALGETDE